MAFVATTLFSVNSGDSVVARQLHATRYERSSAEKSADAARVVLFRHALEEGLDSFDADLATLQSSHISAGEATVAQRAFRRARQDYKHIEALVEFYAPTLVNLVNGPTTEENDDEPTDNRLFPKGFPLLEPIFFPVLNREHIRDIAPAVASMRATIRQFRAATRFVTVTNAQLLELARLEVTRVSVLGVAGFDAAQSGDGIVESAAALEGVQQLFTIGGRPSEQKLAHTLQRAVGYLRAHPRFNGFDRFTFITQYANPAVRAIGAAERGLSDPQLVLRRAWLLGANSIFDAGAIDPMAYAPAGVPKPGPQLIALGRELFFDPVLSGNGQRACASCHRPDRAFADGLSRARQFGPGAPLTRHTPSLVNVAYQPVQFADERATTLEQQVAVVLASPAEMHSSAQQAANTLRQSDEYRREFARVFTVRQDTAINTYRLQVALASYVRSLTGLNSRFDRAMRGNPELLLANERHGFNLFMGKGRCGTCHFAPLFNGTAPPTYMSDEVEVIGVPTTPVTHHAILDPDSGRAAIDLMLSHMYAFKVPTVRNATLAGRYMHNGVYRTLSQVLDFYNRGGGSGIGTNVPNPTLSTDPLHLSVQEQRDIIAFLGTLVDTAGLTARPSQLPRFDPSKRLNDRPIGGRY
jgi:cytochrome c peroxidase